MANLLIFDTHPIQYRSPVFQALARRHPSLKVYFFNAEFNSRRWWFHEFGKTPRQNWGRVLDQGFPCEVLGTGGLSWQRLWSRLSLILEEARPSAVLIYGYYLPEHWALRLLCARRGVPLIFIGETFASSRAAWRQRVKEPFLRHFFRGVSQFVTIGSRNREFYRGWGVPDSRLVDAHYCVDIDFFRLPPAEHEAERWRWRAENRIAATAFVTLFVGRLFARKRPLDVLDIERRIEPAADIAFAMVGNGELETVVRAAAGRTRIRLLGFRDQAQTRAAYHGADLLIVPSEYETWGLVANEAFACGLPAVVSDTCGVAGDLVTDGETGFVYRAGDTAAAAAAVLALASDRARCRRMGERAQARVCTEYTPDRFASAIVSALERATS